MIWENPSKTHLIRKCAEMCEKYPMKSGVVQEREINDVRDEKTPIKQTTRGLSTEYNRRIRFENNLERWKERFIGLIFAMLVINRTSMKNEETETRFI